MRRDPFLSAMLAGILILAVAAVVLFITRQKPLEYSNADTPEAVVSDYITALRKGDYAFAADLIGNVPGKSDAAAVRAAMEMNLRRDINQTGAEVGKAVVDGDSAFVEVQVYRSGGGLFADPYIYTESAELARVEGSWRIMQMPYPFWWYPWSDAELEKKP